ncbi:MAG TPA: LuxR C-terminal-related transcriptional regulator [Sphingomonas sp.]|nr:LuxR C-terminal-related transcriptional regulator [Sphingomonas sp.]
MHELIQTKTAPPSWMGDKIRRSALLDRLDGALGKRLTVIQAPAGYGKTSLLLQWRHLHENDALVIAWLTLEKDDADPKRLTQYVSLALGAPDIGSGAAVAADLPPRAALSAIINRLVREPRPVVMIFDDFHRAESPAVVDLLKALIRLAPENCHFIVASRDHPRLDQAVLAAEDQLLELRSEDLRFSGPEAEALLLSDQGVELGADDIRRIVERTEGWPIALQLMLLSLRQGADYQQFVERLGGSSLELAGYLSEQVFAALPDEVREMVIRTTLVDTLTGDLVNALCERQDGWLILEQLEQQGVFLTPLSDERRAFRYHQLFAEHMRRLLARDDIAKFQALQGVAARWFAAHDNVGQAVDHAILAQNPELLLEIVDEAGAWRLIPNGLQDVAARALDALPEERVRAAPRLMLMRIYLAIKQGEMGEARADYDWLVESADQGNYSADLWTEIHVVGDILLEYENVPVTLGDLLAREALLRTMPANDHLMLGNACESLGAKYYEAGRLERAIEPTLAAREHYQARGSLYSGIFTRFLEARIRHDQARMKDATSILVTARAEIENRFGADSDLSANCSAFEAALLYEQDRLSDALALLDWALPHMEQSDGWVDVYAAAYLTAARAASADGGADEARALLARARRLAQRRRLRQLELLADLCELELLLQRFQADDAADRLAEAIGLDALADEMALESPVFRKVAIAASLCRVKLRLVRNETALALAELGQLRRWGVEHGSGRLLIDVDLLTACGLHRSGEAAGAQSHFDEAVGVAMFQEIKRPFLDARRFSEPLVKATLQGAQRVDRFRDQFLKELCRSFGPPQAVPGIQGGFTPPEIAVLTYLSNGYANKEIARLIDMSPDTVKYRLKSLFRKLGVNKRRDAVAVARERNLIADAARRDVMSS